MPSPPPPPLPDLSRLSLATLQHLFPALEQSLLQQHKEEQAIMLMLRSGKRERGYRSSIRNGRKAMQQDQDQDQDQEGVAAAAYHYTSTLMVRESYPAPELNRNAIRRSSIPLSISNGDGPSSSTPSASSLPSPYSSRSSSHSHSHSHSRPSSCSPYTPDLEPPSSTNAARSSTIIPSDSEAKEDDDELGSSRAHHSIHFDLLELACPSASIDGRGIDGPIIPSSSCKRIRSGGFSTGTRDELECPLTPGLDNVVLVDAERRRLLMKGFNF